MNNFRLSLVPFICVLFSLFSFAEEETEKPELDVRELSPGLYVGEGETPAGEKIYFGMERITADSEPGIVALERMTSKMFQRTQGLVSVSLYFCMNGKSNYSSLDDYKGIQQIGLNNTEFEAFHRRLCDRSSDLNSRWERMVGFELNFRAGSEGDYVAYVATKKIEKPNTWKGETIKEYLDTTKNLIMTAAVSKESIQPLKGFQRTYVSMIDGGHKDAAAYLHGFISAVAKKIGNPKASSTSSTPIEVIEVIEAPFEEECRKIDVNKPQTIKPAIDACSSWIQWAREEEKKLNSLSYLEKQEKRLPKLPDSAVEEALINMKNACKLAEVKNWNCLNMTAGLQNQLAEKIAVRPELNEPLLIEEAFVFQNMDEVPDDVLRGFPAPCAEPSLWSPADKKRVKDLLESYSKKLPEFMKTLEAGSRPGGAPIALVKCKKTDGENGRVATAFSKGYMLGSRYLFLAEHVFTTDSDPKISEYLGFQTLSFTLLHELAHLWDFSHEKNVSSTQEFINIFGWVEAGSFGLGQLKTFKKSEIKENLTEMMKLAGAGKYLDALKTTVEFGRTHGYPTSYSMSVPKEMLAEFVAWIYHSPETKKYLEPKLLDYVKNNILK